MEMHLIVMVHLDKSFTTEGISRQIGLQSCSNDIKRQGRVWTRMFPNIPIKKNGVKVKSPNIGLVENLVILFEVMCF